ncbi:MAG: M50 family metallopeptidase [Anaerolineae bacterium]
MTRTNGQESPHTSLLLAGGAFALSLILERLPLLGWLAYAFRLFDTLIHELSHGLMALLTGGHFLHFVIAPDSSGMATTAGGWRLLVVPAGYLGTALFGGALLLLTNRSSPRTRRWLALGLGVFFVLVTALFARNWGAVFVGGLWAVALVALAEYGPPLVQAFGLNLLAIQCSLNALDSLGGLVRLNTGPYQRPNDAQTMADLTHLPAAAWALLWSLMALVIFIGSVYLCLRKRDSS